MVSSEYIFSLLIFVGVYFIPYRMIYKWAQRAIISDQRVSRSRILLVIFTLFLLSTDRKEI